MFSSDGYFDDDDNNESSTMFSSDDESSDDSINYLFRQVEAVMSFSRRRQQEVNAIDATLSEEIATAPLHCLDGFRELPSMKMEDINSSITNSSNSFHLNENIRIDGTGDIKNSRVLQQQHTTSVALADDLSSCGDEENNHTLANDNQFENQLPRHPRSIEIPRVSSSSCRFDPKADSNNNDTVGLNEKEIEIKRLHERLRECYQAVVSIQANADLKVQKLQLKVHQLQSELKAERCRRPHQPPDFPASYAPDVGSEYKAELHSHDEPVPDKKINSSCKTKTTKDFSNNTTPAATNHRLALTDATSTPITVKDQYIGTERNSIQSNKDSIKEPVALICSTNTNKTNDLSPYTLTYSSKRQSPYDLSSIRQQQRQQLQCIEHNNDETKSENRNDSFSLVDDMDDIIRLVETTVSDQITTMEPPTTPPPCTKTGRICSAASSTSTSTTRSTASSSNCSNSGRLRPTYQTLCKELLSKHVLIPSKTKT